MIMVFGSLRVRVAMLFLSMFSVALVGFIDERTGTELSVSIFYLVPVLAVAWYAGWWPVVVVSALSGIVWCWVEAHSGHAVPSLPVLVWNTFVRLAFFVVNGYLVVQLRVYLERERRRARHDTLTGLLNGYAFLQEAESCLALARRKGKTFTLVYIDLDDFKKVNDTLGHNEGDKVLCAVAETLRRSTRQYDLVARLGGDEFAVMFPETGSEEAEVCVRKIYDVLEERVAFRPWPVSFSVGAATFKELPGSMEVALNAADTLMYRVKRAGKRGVLRKTWPFELDARPLSPEQEAMGLAADPQISLNA